MDRPRITSIGRPVDPAWPTNRAIIFLSLTVIAVVAAFRLLFGGLALVPAVVAGVLAGATVFFAWALAREVDPDHDLAAFVGALIALPTWELLGSPRFAIVLLLLLALRIVNRTVGPAARPLDSIAILLLASWVAWNGGWVETFAVFLAFLLDATLAPGHRLHLAGAGAALALTGVAASRAGFPPAIASASPVSLGALALMLPFLAVMGRSGTLRTLTDVGALPLSAKRVRSSQALAILAVVLAVFVDGTEGLGEISPLWAAIVGCGLFGLYSKRRAAV
jgi:hypothetical protein